MKQTNDLVIIGRIGKPFGLQGFIKIQSFTEPESNIFLYFPWQIHQGQQTPRTVAINEWQQQGEKLVIKIENCETPEQARLYTGADIAIFRHQLPKLTANEYYWSDLEGLTVINQQGVTLGIVEYLFEAGANDVLVVKNDANQLLIPYALGKYVLNIDLENKTILVDWDAEF
jgi:16S rRNA processing protein RimM